ncbi:MAG: 7-cyano-7-deazaguanine synthase QueC [Methanobrevibacter arboriphilus]|uniref:7-cyano-7-deazaguanine synthase n=1 Tax=Methanobrevibacter arboriphilus TaxID=39441 RepID=A0A843AH29_METAZ|nr:7-cyano-7-deazaguanine synthase QueC [Methanobrevibacter arboriphilus]MBF4469041.1 7-cyano-7-deazaguanine synthase QueC [Methanobrevibacter arboriphilus]
MKFKNSNNKKAISVLSGGLDSTVATSFFSKDYDIHAITFNYGQKSLDQEINASKKICKKLGMRHTIIDIRWLANLGNSALTNDNDIPEVTFDDIDNIDVSKKTANKVWVPGRNVVFTAIATSFAESESADIIIVGWDKEEAATFPDNSKEFLNSFNELINIGTISSNKIEIKAPLIDLDKIEIVKLGKNVDAPMDISYSCYTGENNHCGVCESCVRRKRAFIEAEIDDQTIYIE